MARSQQLERDLIDQTVEEFATRCLLADGSLLFSERTVWSTDNLSELRRKLVDEYIAGTEQNFKEKLSEQLDGAPDTARIASEVLLVYCLFVFRAISPWTKRNLVEFALSSGGVDVTEIDRESVAWRALDQGIGHPGARYNRKRPDELAYLINVTLAIKAEERREELLTADEPWAFQEWLDELEVEHTQFRHILLHLLWPDHYERMASGGHKSVILDTYGGLADEGEDDQDRQLLSIRRRLREILGREDADVDFYRPPLNEWLTGAPADQQALRHKGQLVFHGPPGTSKTYDAERLAEAIIRSDAIRLWGVAEYFERQEEIPDVVRAHRHRRQFHPAYSYEDFIGGLQLGEGGSTHYEPGYFPKLCTAIAAENEADGERALPHVLILDELNRADLSRVLGEAFSGLEMSQRGKPIQLSGADPDQPLVIPENLYVIGTMNLIDQSVEQLDFALRRRFLWRRSGFDRERLLGILEEQWLALEAEDGTKGIGWDTVSTDMEALGAAAGKLNDKIAEIDLLGPQYEIGHTYFADIVPILAAGLTAGRRVFLWGRGRHPQTAELEQFWDLSLEPLIDEYLAGLDQDTRQKLADDLRTTFLASPEQ